MLAIFFPGSNTAPDGGFSSMMLMMLGWLVVATCLYLLRPNSLRNRGDMKPSRNNDPSPPPPGPSVS